VTETFRAEAHRSGYDQIQIHCSDSLTTVEREVLRLLATGATHQTVAHRLEIPLRTVRRRIAALMMQLGAISPFQAGAEAARRGWLNAPLHESHRDNSQPR